jgi:hypothetical protein
MMERADGDGDGFLVYIPTYLWCVSERERDNQ